MNPPTNHPDSFQAMSRRRFLHLGGAGVLAGIATLAGAGAADRLGLLQAGAAPDQVDYQPRGDVRDTGLILVNIQLAGGLDFLNTVVPAADGRYRDVRREGSLDAATLLPLDDTYALHGAMPGLAQAWGEGDVAIVHGVGWPDSSLSHFADTDIWTRGRLEVGDGTGWLGRSLNALADDVDPLIGISIGELSPSMYGPGWSAVALPTDGTLPWTARFIEDHPGIVAAYQQLLTAPSPMGAMPSLREQVRSSQQLVRDVAGAVEGATDLERIARAAEMFEEPEGEDAASDGLLTTRLAMVADLINGGLPTRAYHVAHGDFDTHANQESAFPTLLGDLDTAISSFRTALGPNADRVVIATWTEFGRRPDWNGNGTEHGTAGTQFVIGPRVAGGHYGEPSPLDRFDRDDNFLVTTDFKDYLGGLATGVLGVDAAHAAPGVTRPMEFIA